MRPIPVIIKSFLNRLPYIRTLYRIRVVQKRNMRFSPGHFYSPVVSVDEIKANEDRVWKPVKPQEILGIDFRADEQMKLIKILCNFYDELPFQDERTEGLRYYFKNKFYSYTDGIVLYAMLRHLRPKRVVEIGSGYTSALMLDINEHFLSNAAELTFIEPFPTRLNMLMTPQDKERAIIIESFVQDVDLDLFKTLQSGDILFVDSSHVVKTGSDLNHILFHILPELDSGVYVHFHDVFYPFEYPKKWVFKGFNWNENYFLRAFLMYNTNFEIALFSHYLHKFYSEAFEPMPLTFKNTGGNLWIRKK